MQTGYVRTLELSLAWSFTNIPGVEEGLKHALQDTNVQATISGKDVEGSNKLHKKWRRSVICKRIDRLLSGAGPTDSHAEDSNASSEDEEEDSHIQQSTVGETTLLTPVSQPMGRINPNYSNERSLLDLCKATNSVSTTGPINLQQLKLPDNLWRLLDIFFAFTHSWFPTVEKHDILRISYSYPQDGLTITSGTPRVGDHALLWSILALASIQDTSVLQLSQAPRPDATVYSSRDLCTIAANLLSSDPDPISLGHAQAIIVRALMEINSSSFEKAWMSLAQAIRIVLLVDSSLLSGSAHINTDPKVGKLPSVLYGCFILDTLLSSKLNKIPMLTCGHMKSLGPLAADSLEEWHPWDGCIGLGPYSKVMPTRIPSYSLSIFNQLYLLTKYVNEYCLEPKAPGKNESILSQVQSLWEKLPTACMLDWRSDAEPTPQKLALHVALRCIPALFGQAQEQEKAAREIATLLDRFTNLFAIITIPPFLLLLLLMVTQQESGEKLPQGARDTIEKTISAILSAWTTHDMRQEPQNYTTPTAPKGQTSPVTLSTSTTDQPCAAHTASIDTTTDATAWIPIPFASPSSTTITQKLPAQTLTNPDPIIPKPPPPLSVTEKVDIPNPNTLQGYTPLGSLSLDIDALFDDLDGPERSSTQPQFMQNLGFAPGADLTDILAGDYGQFDPLLATYMSGDGNMFGLQAGGDSGEIFDPG